MWEKKYQPLPWSEVVTKIARWELLFIILKEFGDPRISEKEGLFWEVMHEICHLCEMIILYFDKVNILWLGGSPRTWEYNRLENPSWKIQPQLGTEEWAQTLLAQTLWIHPGLWDIPAKLPGRPRFLPSQPKENKLSGRERTPHHLAVSGTKRLILLNFSLPLRLKLLHIWFKTNSVRGLEKGLANREGVGTRKSLPFHRSGPFFCPLFPMPPYE